MGGRGPHPPPHLDRRSYHTDDAGFLRSPEAGEVGFGMGHIAVVLTLVNLLTLRVLLPLQQDAGLRLLVKLPPEGENEAGQEP